MELLAPWLKLSLMALLLIGSPGPAAMALVAVGASQSLKAGVPLALGLISGVALTALLSALGMLQLLTHWPEFRLLVQWLGAGFIVLLALCMFNTPLANGQSTNQFGFASGLLMNLLNPKAYSVFALLIGQFLPTDAEPIYRYLGLLVSCVVATLVALSCWLLAGKLLGILLTSDAARERLGQGFAFLRLLFVVPMIFSLSPE